MQPDLDALHAWFLGTVPGVILLGAVGSVVGWVLILLARVLFAVGRRNHFLVALAYRLIGRPVGLATSLRNSYSAQVQPSAYLIYVIATLTFFALESVATMVIAAATVTIAVVYGLSRPLLLVVGIAASLSLTVHFLRSLACIVCLTQTPADAIEERLRERYPKRFRDRLAQKKAVAATAAHPVGPESPPSGSK